MGIKQEFQQILFEMKWLLPWGSVTSYGSGHGIADSRPPAGVRLEGPSEELPHVYWSARWDKAISSAQKEAVLSEAKADLREWHKKPEGTIEEESREQWEARMISEGQGWTVEDVARSFKCTTTLVRRVRVSGGRDVLTGKLIIKAKKVPRSERATRVQQMRSEGRSIRQIAMLLKCDPMTVHRDLVA